MSTDKLRKKTREWADTAEELAETYRDPDRPLSGEDWVQLNALAEELGMYANDLMGRTHDGR